MSITHIAAEAWNWFSGSWFADTGVNIALLILLALLVPRAGRFANRVAERRADQLSDADEAKSHLAISGVAIYIVQAIAFFLILVFFLQQLGFSLAGAAIPATVVSAAIGFGAQSIIADFVAGFFILSEKQYGVGDFVTFEGNGVKVSGDVIQITMRATQIRTLEQATVSIPNSTARICINQSNYWSSAVVVIPVPLLGSDSADAAVARSESAARRALSRTDIRPKVLDDLAVHPAVAVNPPVTVGMPWTVDMRFIVRVEPLSQWMVERAIRMSILNEFWDEYGSATTIEGTRLDHVVEHTGQFDKFPPTEYMPPVRPASNDTDDLSPVESENDPATDALADEEKPAPRMAFGGAMRLSTLVLLSAFAILLVIRAITFEPAEAGAGTDSAPAATSTTPSTAAAETELPPTPQPTTALEPTVAQTTEPPAVPGDDVTDTASTDAPTTAADGTAAGAPGGASISDTPPSQTDTPVG
ncbi:mechanosensitive ion channel [Corynebacterium qintianiae]|uniref:Mechanosensitive ion channel n=1 Tax=Corynebacterium qintianiae TaxID=2709392 RepID=A0A7T0KPF5_9CORY|nr:mechanosensitive ion channel family protein [Corynebacterium qintianiae]QPK84054.1 mechanosensitive ion channel [Corynebacterium qintianiae]